MWIRWIRIRIRNTAADYPASYPTRSATFPACPPAYPARPAAFPARPTVHTFKNEAASLCCSITTCQAHIDILSQMG
jgi:hypothetical protein